MKPNETDGILRKPPWIRVRIPAGENYLKIRDLVRQKGLHTVCAEALCPNKGECWAKGTATFMILGDICTRDCRFCGVKTGVPSAVKPGEPEEVAEAVSIMNLKHAVITSVTRDDLPDGGAAVFAGTIGAIHQRVSGCSVEVLVPDFDGRPASITKVIDAGPEVYAHNMETVSRLYPQVRSQANYSRSLEVLRTAKKIRPKMITKSGIMIGLGESGDEILKVMDDVRETGCDILTIGQYLRPTRSHFPVLKYYSPEEFMELKEIGLKLGFRWVESGPLVRSSYHAESHYLSANG
jgi:lipoic acid synthetase